MIVLWYFCFHPPCRLRDVWAGKAKWTSVFGHVEAWGCTADGKWLFLDPVSELTIVAVFEDGEEIDNLMGLKFEACQCVLKLPPQNRGLWFPFHVTMNCVSVCAKLVGLRAYTPWGFRRLLLKNNARIVYDAQSQPGREPGGTSGP